jgi:serine/threonine protein kinase
MNDLRSTLIVGEEIAHGHFGRVHRGRDGIRDKLAVKALFAMGGEPPEQWAGRKKGLLAEGANLEKARHRNIVAVHYLCASSADDAVLLVMEFCEGGSLERSYRANPLQPDIVLKIARDVCHGLSALHQRGMLHRDLKPGNILLDEKGVAKIGDFGFVTDEIVEGYAAGGGYRDHLAPEFYEARVSSIRTDLWALGVTLYRLLHGHSWYESSPAPRAVVPDGGYADRLEWLPHIGKKWRRIIRSLLSDDPASRPEHARALNRMLAEVDPSGWGCNIEEDEITWKKSKGKRVLVAKLTKHNQRSYSWEVKSLPTGKGVARTIRANSNVGYRKAEKELKAYFQEEAEK